MVWHDKYMLSLQSLEEEEKMTPEQLAIKNVGKQVHWSSGFYFSTQSIFILLLM